MCVDGFGAVFSFDENGIMRGHAEARAARRDVSSATSARRAVRSSSSANKRRATPSPDQRDGASVTSAAWWRSARSLPLARLACSDLTNANPGPPSQVVTLPGRRRDPPGMAPRTSPPPARSSRKSAACRTPPTSRASPRVGLGDDERAVQDEAYISQDHRRRCGRYLRAEALLAEDGDAVRDRGGQDFRAACRVTSPPRTTTRRSTRDPEGRGAAHRAAARGGLRDRSRSGEGRVFQPTAITMSARTTRGYVAFAKLVEGAAAVERKIARLDPTEKGCTEIAFSSQPISGSIDGLQIDNEGPHSRRRSREGERSGRDSPAERRVRHRLQDRRGR